MQVCDGGARLSAIRAGLLIHAAEELHELCARAGNFDSRVPGSFEIPVVVQRVGAKEKKTTRLSPCGVIHEWEETNHAKI